MADELAKAITKIIYPMLKPKGFHRVRKRDLIRVENGIVQLLYFQVNRWGGRDFCVTACANLLAANDFVSGQPGFRLGRDAESRDLWLPSLTTDEAERSASAILDLIRSEALPYFAKIRTVVGFRALLVGEQWAAAHHLNFDLGVAAALEGDVAVAQRHLAIAIPLYEWQGSDWCAAYIEKAKSLQDALVDGTAPQLLRSWEQANRKAHGIK